MQYIKNIIKKAFFLYEFSPHKKLGINYYSPSEKEFAVLREDLVKHYFSKFSFPFPSQSQKEIEEGFSWMDDHLTLRLEHYRNLYIPFLNSIKNLNGATVLDVGCGTGASLVALAEAGAKVFGIDIDEGSLIVAKNRCEIYGVDVETARIPADEINTFKPELKFDFIIFNASLEHMLPDERISGLKAAWDRLSSGDSYIGIIECPNRLWYFDSHTSSLPFFDWLPEKLALRYLQFSSRKYINEYYKLPPTDENIRNFSRLGRGMSYHEIDIAIGNADNLKVINSLENYILSESNWLEKIRYKKIIDVGYQNFIKEKSGRNLHGGFFESWLNLVIQKS